MSQPEPFDVLAAYYDWEHDRFRDDIGLYLEYARRAGDPVLELACGTGRLMLPLAESGRRVVGLDSSPAMLAIAERKIVTAGVKDRVETRLADMRSFALVERFPIALVALDSFGLLTDRSEQLACLSATRAHLLPGGLFVIDVSNASARGSEPREEIALQCSGASPISGHRLDKWRARSTDLAAQVDHFTYFYDETGPDGSVRRLTAQLDIRYFGRFELELLLERAGLTVQAVFGSYELGPFDEASDRLIVVASKPGLDR